MKKIRLALIIMVASGILYFVGSIIYGIVKTAGKNNLDFSYVDLNFKMHPDDSVYFTEATKSNLVIDYTSKFKNYQYLSVYRYKGKYNLIVRKLADVPANLNVLFKLEFKKSKADMVTTYDIQDASPLIYKIAVDRPHGMNKNLMINGDDIKVLKRTADTLWIRGDILDMAIGEKEKYVNELISLSDETLLANAVNIELLLFNRDNKLYFYVIYPDGKTTVPKGILSEIR